MVVILGASPSTDMRKPGETLENSLHSSPVKAHTLQNFTGGVDTVVGAGLSRVSSIYITDLVRPNSGLGRE